MQHGGENGEREKKKQENENAKLWNKFKFHIFCFLFFSLHFLFRSPILHSLCCSFSLCWNYHLFVGCCLIFVVILRHHRLFLSFAVIKFIALDIHHWRHTLLHGQWIFGPAFLYVMNKYKIWMSIMKKKENQQQTQTNK